MMTFGPGTTIDCAAKMLVALAEGTGKWQIGCFNGTPIVGFAGADPIDVMRRYFEAREPR